MNFEWRTLTVGLAAFTLASLVASLAVPVLASRQRTIVTALRARRLASLRLLPAAAAGAAGLVVTAAFLAFEPRGPHEHLGWSVQGVALFGLALLLAALWRWMRIMIATRRVTREWFAGAEPIALPGVTVPAFVVHSSFPIVAIVGLRRPRLVIARAVLAACTTEELRAILAHEQGHLDRRDNLRRLLMAVTPDVLAWLPLSGRLFAAWNDAAEEAADDDAARAGGDGRLHLAAALVKVARLTTGRPAGSPTPASAFYCGQNLDTRVRRLLDPPAAPAAGRSAFSQLAAAAAIAIATVAVLPGLHALIEVAVRALP